MSVRSLFEFNHDFTGKIEEHPEEFAQAIIHYLRNGEERKPKR